MHDTQERFFENFYQEGGGIYCVDGQCPKERHLHCVWVSTKQGSFPQEIDRVGFSPSKAKMIVDISNSIIVKVDCIFKGQLVELSNLWKNDPILIEFPF